MSAFDIIFIIIFFVIVLGVLVKLIFDKRRGKGGDCSSCAGCTGCTGCAHRSSCSTCPPHKNANTHNDKKT